MSNKIGILTGGGDAPGLNAVIRGIVLRGSKLYNYEFLGILDGWKGMLKKLSMPISIKELEENIALGGTVVGTSRTNPLKIENGINAVLENFKALDLHALIAIGGDDTLGVATQLYKQGLNVVGVPKTIDNDLSGTDYTFGFDTAINIVADAFDKLRTTTKSHHRVMVVEIMGRHAGWITLHGGIAGGADVILIPEKPFDLDEVCDNIKRAYSTKNYAMVAVSEGAVFESEKGLGDMVLQTMEKDSFGHVRLGGIGKILADEIQKRTGFESREVLLGHLQRGGSPSAFDRVLATRFGSSAIDLVYENKFGMAPCLKGLDIIPLKLEDMTKENKIVHDKLLNEFKGIFE